MKHNIKTLLKGSVALLCAGGMFTSCDFLDREPLDQVSPDQYYTTAEQLGGFTLNYYGTIFPNNSGWWAGVATFDNGTDNQAAGGGNERIFLPDKWRVPTSGGIGYNTIRDLNKFINEVEAKYAEHKIDGSDAMIKEYIGEAYAIRGMVFFDRLKSFGDYPIELKELNIDADLAAASKRQPRNLVARQILSDLDKAIERLPETAANKLRFTKRAVLTLKSRVALYEGTFEKYHRGTGRVPGDANWPGKGKEWLKDFTIDQDAEVNYFLDEAIKAAKEAAANGNLPTKNTHKFNPTERGQYNGWNPYYDMFASEDLSKFPEVLMWRQFNSDISVSHLTSNKLRTGSATGWTRGLVESFLTKSGKPIYAADGEYQGDKTIDDVKKDRDERLQLFVFGESDILATDDNSIKVDGNGKDLVKFTLPIIVTSDAQTKDITGYRQRKFYNYDPKMQNGQSFSDVSGQILIRVEEAMLNYMEAYYVRHNTLDDTAKKYWTALRERAGITAPIETTVSATNMAEETKLTRAYDWGAYSAGKPLESAMLYSIRRERRSELAGEGYRWDDLVRWAAMDQVKDYVIEGVNFWEEMSKSPKFKNTEGGSLLVDDGGDKATVSSHELSHYLRPYQINKKYSLYQGYTFYKAHYLSPFSYQEMQLCSPDGTVEHSYLYQNVYWPAEANGAGEQ